MAWAPDYITVEELGDYVRIDDTIDDVELTAAIAGASRAIDRHIGRQFGIVDAPEPRSYTACPDFNRGFWSVNIDDLMTTAGLIVEIVDVGIVTTFALEPLNSAEKGRPWTRLAFTADSEFYPTGRVGEISITANWGWTEVPDAIKQATLMQSTRFFSRRSAPFGVAGSPELGSELRLLSRVDPDVAVSLRDFRRMRSLG